MDIAGIRCPISEPPRSTFHCELSFTRHAGIRPPRGARRRRVHSPVRMAVRQTCHRGQLPGGVGSLRVLPTGLSVADHDLVELRVRWHAGVCGSTGHGVLSDAFCLCADRRLVDSVRRLRLRHGIVLHVRVRLFTHPLAHGGGLRRADLRAVRGDAGADRVYDDPSRHCMASADAARDRSPARPAAHAVGGDRRVRHRQLHPRRTSADRPLLHVRLRPVRAGRRHRRARRLDLLRAARGRARARRRADGPQGHSAGGSQCADGAAVNELRRVREPCQYAGTDAFDAVPRNHSRGTRSAYLRRSCCAGICGDSRLAAVPPLARRLLAGNRRGRPADRRRRRHACRAARISGAAERPVPRRRAPSRSGGVWPFRPGRIRTCGDPAR